MNEMYYLRLFFPAALVLAACTNGEIDSAASGSDVEPKPSARYVVMDDTLKTLKDDFNAHADKVRFVFLSGPTCGICLRGMADLNDEFIESMQGDPRFHVFVVYVPTLGAREEHVSQAMPLLDGPNVTHYWEDTGIIGMHYHDLLEVRAYVWDFWAIYRPGVLWDDTMPPEPDYWEHQLTAAGGPFTSDLELDAERYARVAKQMIDEVSDASLAAEAVAQETTHADGLVIPKVAQPRGVAIQQHIMGRGGYKNLKRITAIEMVGHMESGDSAFALSVRTERPDRITRVLEGAGVTSSASFDGESVTPGATGVPRGLPGNMEAQLLGLFEFDGPFVEWKDKGHQIQMLGMKKYGRVLAWELELTQIQGQHWNLLVDSHSGSIIQATALGDSGEPQFVIHADDFRDVSGFLFPHRIEYRSAAGELIAAETYSTINVAVEKFDLEEAVVRH